MNQKQTGNAERMREAIAKRQQSQARSEMAAETKPTPPAEAKKPPKEKGPQVKHACGHEVGVAYYANGKCPACTNKARKERNQAKFAAKADARLPMEKPPQDEQRLPDGSIFQARYDAPTKRWKGIMTIYIAGVEQMFTDDSGAVMKLLRKLDGQYREWLEKSKESPS